jgi:hypothetical protein
MKIEIGDIFFYCLLACAIATNCSRVNIEKEDLEEIKQYKCIKE